MKHEVMNDFIEFSHFFLAKPNVSLLRMRSFISCKMFRISPGKSARGIRPLNGSARMKYSGSETGLNGTGLPSKEIQIL